MSPFSIFMIGFISGMVFTGLLLVVVMVIGTKKHKEFSARLKAISSKYESKLQQIGVRRDQLSQTALLYLKMGMQQEYLETMQAFNKTAEEGIKLFAEWDHELETAKVTPDPPQT